MNPLRLGVAVALAAAVLAPLTAHAGTGCRPDIRLGETTVAGQTVPTAEYHGTICY